MINLISSAKYVTPELIVNMLRNIVYPCSNQNKYLLIGFPKTV